jgi:hypothetical protein
VQSVEQASSDDAGEYYAMAMASVKRSEEIMESATIVIPLKNSRAGEVLDLTFVADCIFPTASRPAAEVCVRPLRCVLSRRA